MRKTFSSGNNSKAFNIWMLVLRIAVAAFMLTHGLPKLQKLIAGNIEFADPFGWGAGISLGLAVFAEVVCSLLILLGAVTRFAAIPLIITMLVAAFSANANQPFAKKELALVYLLIFITIAVFGAGKYSIDGGLNKRGKR